METAKRSTTRRERPAVAAAGDHGRLLARVVELNGAACVFALASLALLAGVVVAGSALPMAFRLAALVTAAAGVFALCLSRRTTERTGSGQDRGHLTFAAPLAPKARAIDSRLEEIADARWALSENEARYRDLLDGQHELISRRDSSGRIIFANRAYCRVFGREPAEIVGKRFRPRVLDGEFLPPLDRAGAQRRSFEELVETRSGARWIVWEEVVILMAAPSDYEIQSIGHDVTEERESEAALLEARDMANAANRAKSRFLAAMSHEIRTPMNGILGMTGLLQDTEMTDEQRSYSRAIDGSARALLALIDEILDFSKIEAGKLELARVPFDIRNAVSGAVELFEPRAHEKGLELTCQIDPDVPRSLLGDETRVRQIVLNLVSNAVKFTDHGSIRVTVKTGANVGRDGDIAITVSDTGIGLAEDELVRVFNEFEQAEAALHRRQGGTGLGLAISQRLARAMGGEITGVSAPGQGAAFTVRLKFAQCPSGGHGGADARNPVAIGGGGSKRAERLRQGGTNRPRVLIAEDNEVNALLARRVVEKAICEPVVVRNGAEAVSAVRETLDGSAPGFDLILMDIFMPGLDGIGATRAIRELFEGASASSGRAGRGAPPIIALTANAFAEDRRRCLEAGMSDYLAKPFDVQDLDRLLLHWVEACSPGGADKDAPAA